MSCPMEYSNGEDKYKRGTQENPEFTYVKNMYLFLNV